MWFCHCENLNLFGPFSMWLFVSVSLMCSGWRVAGGGTHFYSKQNPQNHPFPPLRIAPPAITRDHTTKPWFLPAILALHVLRCFRCPQGSFCRWLWQWFSWFPIEFCIAIEDFLSHKFSITVVYMREAPSLPSSLFWCLTILLVLALKKSWWSNRHSH